MLSRFSIIVATDNNGGIAKNGSEPWNSKEYGMFVKNTTVGISTPGKKKNVVIMGRVTYSKIPDDRKPLEGRQCVVVSSEWRQDDHPDIIVAQSLVDALACVGSSQSGYGDVFICGGEQIFKEAVRDLLYLCDNIYLTKFKNTYDCDQFFPIDKINAFDESQDPTKTQTFIRYFYSPTVGHDENIFCQLLEATKGDGEQVANKLKLFGVKVNFSLSRLPFVTTTKLNVEKCITSTIETLEQNGEIFERHINDLKTDPFSAPKIITLAGGLIYQSNVSGDRRFIDCQVYFPSIDLFTEGPQLIATSALLTHVIGHLSGLTPRKMAFVCGECCVAVNCSSAIDIQISRDPRPFPTLKLRGASKLNKISDFKVNSFIIEGYTSWNVINTG